MRTGLAGCSNEQPWESLEDANEDTAMISTRYKCIYVRISKVASQSILKAFQNARRWGERGEFELMHFDLEHYQQTYPRRFRRYFKFSFVRNPWARIYSQYRYQRFTLKADSADTSFTEWLKRVEEVVEAGTGHLFARNRHIFLRHVTNQYDWLTVDGELACDFVGFYESLERDFARVNDRLRARLRLPFTNASKGGTTDHRSAYDDWAVERVADWNRKDLDVWGYRFEVDSPTLDPLNDTSRPPVPPALI